MDPEQKQICILGSTCCCVIFFVVFAILSFGTIEPTEWGLKYSRIHKNLI
jgi:hypothetical protein